MSDSPAAILYDESGNPVAVTLDGTVHKLETRTTINQGGYDAVVLPDGSLQVHVIAPALGAGLVSEYLKEPGGNNEMAINGSATPVVFSWSAGTQDIDGLALALVAEDATIYFGNKFMGINALTNGVLIEVKAGDVVHQLYNFKRTREVAQNAVPGSFQLYSASPDIVFAQVSLSGLKFKKAGTYATDDYARVTIRDNLVGLSHMSMVFSGLEVV